MKTWEFARLQYIARSHGWTEFISMQPFHNLLYREEEREMIPFCQAHGVGIIPWSPIARGLLARPVPKEGQEDEGASFRSKVDKKTTRWFADANLEIVNRVEEIAKKKGVSMALVATAWVLQQGCWPIVGLNSENRIKETVEALKVQLTKEECRYLEEEYRPREWQM
jgi:aryl-alcohol dehydrogenase-like predicted oxidoreductase